jgi:predicted transcriptional regulator
MKTVPVTIRVSEEERVRLQQMSEKTQRSVAYLGHAAIAQYLNDNEWQIAAISEALETLRSGEPGIPHDDVVAWLDTWGTDDEAAETE